MKLYKVLLFESCEECSCVYRSLLVGTSVVLEAPTMELAKRVSEENPDIRIVLLANLKSDPVECAEIAHLFHIRKFSGSVLAIAGDTERYQILRNAGCESFISMFQASSQVEELLR